MPQQQQQNKQTKTSNCLEDKEECRWQGNVDGREMGRTITNQNIIPHNKSQYAAKPWVFQAG